MYVSVFAIGYQKPLLKPTAGASNLVFKLPAVEFRGGFHIKEEHQSQGALYLPVERRARAVPVLSPGSSGLVCWLYVPHPFRLRAVKE